MCERLGKENLKLFYYPLQALLARENTITMHNGHKQVNGESIDFYDVAEPKVALNPYASILVDFSLAVGLYRKRSTAEYVRMVTKYTNREGNGELKVNEEIIIV